MATPKPVLVVDDQATIRALVSTMLVKLGYGPIFQAKHGKEGLAKLKEAQPLVIICDINMPEMNGLEMLQQIRVGKGAIDRAVPVVMLTAHSEAMVVGAALRLDANGFVVKPASGKHLGERIERALAEPLMVKAAEKYAAVTIPVVDTYGAVHMPDDLAKAWKEMSGEMPGAVAKVVDKIHLADLAPGMVVGDWVTTENTKAPVLAPGTVLTDQLVVRLADLVEAGAIPHTIPISQG